MRDIQFVTILCLFSIFTMHTSNHTEIVNELTDKIIIETTKANLSQPGACTKTAMYLGVIFMLTAPISDTEIDHNKLRTGFAIFVAAKIIRTIMRIKEANCVERKKSYQKQLDAILSHALYVFDKHSTKNKLEEEIKII